MEGGAFLLGPGLGVRDLAVAPARPDRRLLSVDEPCLVWEGTGAGATELRAEVCFPVPDLRIERSEDGARLWIAAPGTTAELLVGAVGGTVSVEEIDGRPHLVGRGAGSLRLVVIGADDEADRERTLRALARKGIAGLAAQRRRHASQLEALALRLRSPDASRDAALLALVHAADAELHQRSGGHLGFDRPMETGSTLLALGLREPVRDALRAPLLDHALIELFARYAAWAGADEFVRKQWFRAEAGARGVAGARGARLAALLLPVAEGLGLGSSATALALRAGDVEADRVEVPAAIQELFAIVPEGLDGAVSFAPALPDGWPEMTLERLRIGASTLDLKVRRRPAGVAIKCRLTHGPALVVRLAPRLPFAPSGILVDDEQLKGPSVALTVDGEVEGVWLT